ncbi:TPA: hypothetical protein DDW35_09870 [Candidatus Sumerlaeota bacterium]|nr:hypothetical protein [Candidatus Sumerlaeota bacterium]
MTGIEIYNLSVCGLVKSMGARKIRTLSIFSAFLVSCALLLLVFHPRDDYRIYVQFADAVSQGYNPYSLPSGFESSAVEKLVSLDDSGSPSRKVDQTLADYPPLLMSINGLIFQVDEIKGLYYFYLVLFFLSIVTFVLFHKDDINPEELNKFIFVAFLIFNPLLLRSWFAPIEDKVWFLFFMIMMMVCKERKLVLTSVLAVFAALKGLGGVVFPFYIVHLVVEKKINVKEMVVMILPFLLILAISHVKFFPEWLNGYKWRSQTQEYVGHLSIFSFFPHVFDDYSLVLSKILSFLSLLTVGVLIIKRKLLLKEILLAPVVCTIIFNTDLTMNRIFIAVVALQLIIFKKSVIFYSFMCCWLLFFLDERIVMRISEVFHVVQVCQLNRDYVELIYKLVLWAMTFYLLFSAVKPIILRSRGTLSA